ncbi:unnamed protein product [Heterosigma akashiwo]
MDWTYGYEIGLFCFCFSNAQRVKKELPNAHWFESLVYFMITTFGGSCTVGLVTAGSPGFLKNDILPLMGTLAWFLAVYGPGDFPDHFASMPGVKEVLIFLKELFRGNGCINTVKQANMLFKATKYYPTPITGPIVCGILGSNAGGFFPPSRGLKAIENGYPGIFSALNCFSPVPPAGARQLRPGGAAAGAALPGRHPGPGHRPGAVRADVRGGGGASERPRPALQPLRQGPPRAL